MNIVGYSEGLSVAAGDGLTFFISSKKPRYRAELVRVIHGDKNPQGPGFIVEKMPSNIDGEHAGQVQRILSGSHARVPVDPAFDYDQSFSVALWFWKGDDRGVRQTIASRGVEDKGWWLGLGHDGKLAFRVGRDGVRLSDFPVPPKAWCHVVASFDAATSDISLSAGLQVWPCGLTRANARAKGAPATGAEGAALYFAVLEQGSGERTAHFNGKIENPSLYGAALRQEHVALLENGASPLSIPGIRCAWDFSREPSSNRIVDVTAARCDGELHNLPARAMKGHNWTGEEIDFRQAPQQYGAIHFHDDDLGDAGWEPSLRFEAPIDMRSGIYALHLSDGEDEDYVTFLVTPPVGRANAKIAFLAPTMSYLAYGNEAIANRPDIRQMLEAVGISGSANYPAQQEDKYIVENRLLSCYDIHSDGSGVCYSSHRRPIVSMRPSYLMPLLGLQVRPGGGAHQMCSDLYITHWLETKGFEFDVITDHELHEQGESILSLYKVVITGSHPEYVTRRMWNATQSYLSGGGRLMYCGGNGFFIVTSLTPDGTAIETRRSRTNRPWTSEPGEERHSSTGEVGGPWALNGLPSNALFGVSCASVGFTSGVGYKRTKAAADPRAAFIFDGVDNEEIGAFPNLAYGNGAAGFEVDRADVKLGTPAHAIVVATARLTDDSFQQILHELDVAGPHTSGSVNPANRADMTYLEYPGGGATWTPGSILWAGALSYRNFDNNVSKITENVLRRFLV